jgi:hypothetical protein
METEGKNSGRVLEREREAERGARPCSVLWEGSCGRVLEREREAKMKFSVLAARLPR